MSEETHDWTRPSSGRHNGWTNRETWLVYTGIVNDREQEAHWMAKAKLARKEKWHPRSLSGLLSCHHKDTALATFPIDWEAIADMLIHESIALSSPEEESNE